MRRHSLARRIALTFLACHLAVMLLAFLAIRPIMLSSEDSIQIGPAIAIEAAATDLRRTRDGRLTFEPQGQLATLRQGNPALWLMIRSGDRVHSVGTPPADAGVAFTRLPAPLDTAEFRLPSPGGEAAAERRDTRAGSVLIMVGGVHPSGIGVRAWLAYLVGSEMIWAVPLIALLAVPAVLVATPLALRGLRPIAREAAAIGPAHPERRLTADFAPRELLPLTGAINAALDRLADELERRRRFIADVSHELRTPLAILGLRIAALPPGEARHDLERGQARLEQMVGQMLDAERLALRGLCHRPVDLVEIARETVAEGAPLAIAMGYEIALTGAAGPVIVAGERHAIGRAIANLFGNAVAHGGGGGMIEVNVTADRTIEVRDEGPGIAREARERVFEPFYRERWDRDGCGLGLHLVREIMLAHGGEATVPDGLGGRVRLTFPPMGAPLG